MRTAHTAEGMSNLISTCRHKPLSPLLSTFTVERDSEPHLFLKDLFCGGQMQALTLKRKKVQ